MARCCRRILSLVAKVNVRFSLEKNETEGETDFDVTPGLNVSSTSTTETKRGVITNADIIDYNKCSPFKPKCVSCVLAMTRVVFQRLFAFPTLQLAVFAS